MSALARARSRGPVVACSRHRSHPWRWPCSLVRGRARRAWSLGLVPMHSTAEQREEGLWELLLVARRAGRGAEHWRLGRHGTRTNRQARSTFRSRGRLIICTASQVPARWRRRRPAGGPTAVAVLASFLRDAEPADRTSLHAARRCEQCSRRRFAFDLPPSCRGTFVASRSRLARSVLGAQIRSLGTVSHFRRISAWGTTQYAWT